MNEPEIVERENDFMIRTLGMIAKNGTVMREQILGLTLAAIFFWISLGLGVNHSDSRYWIESTWSILRLEWGYIALFSILAGVKAHDLIWKEHRFIALLAILWVAAVCLSAWLSPFARIGNPLVAMRLAETFTHALFFLSLWGSFTLFHIRAKWIYIAIIAGTLLSLSGIIYLEHFQKNLMTHGDIVLTRSALFPVNTLIRRIGYQLEVAVILLLAFWSTKFRYIVMVLILTFITYMVCLGGRASLLGTFTALGIWFYLNRQQVHLSVKQILLS